MPKRYSNDLREGVLAYKDNNHTQEETCEVFGISRTTLNTWLKLRRETGSAHAQPYAKTRRRRVAEQKLKAYLEEHPDAYLREIAVEFEVSATAIMYACRRYSITRKKKTTRYAKRDTTERQAFQETLAKLDDKQLVWVDECGIIAQGLYRLHARSPQGVSVMVDNSRQTICPTH